MPKSNPPSTALTAIQTPAEEKWKQQVRLACVQAVTARAVASGVAYDVDRTIEAAKQLAAFVVGSD
jgi:hypothetical protein